MDPLGDPGATHERVRCAARDPDHAEAVDSEVAGQREDVRGPVEQRASRLEVRQPESGPLGNDQAGVAFGGERIVR